MTPIDHFHQGSNGWEILVALLVHNSLDLAHNTVKSVANSTSQPQIYWNLTGHLFQNGSYTKCYILFAIHDGRPNGKVE